jgi:hypothetical protein
VFIEKNNFEKKKNGKHQISLNKMEEVKHGFKRERRKIQKQHQIIHKLYIEQQMRKLEERNYICKENKAISQKHEIYFRERGRKKLDLPRKGWIERRSELLLLLQSRAE